MYTQLGTSEDMFIKLESTLKKYKSGGVPSMWRYEPDIDVTDLKTWAFDYIRLGHHQDEFRDIIRIPSSTASSFFATKDIWNSFKQKHFEIVDSQAEVSVQDTIRSSPGADVGRLLKIRDNDWRNKVKESLKENFNKHQDKLHNKLEATEPLRLLNKALDALQNIDNKAIAEITSTDIGAVLSSIELRLNQIKSSIAHG